MRIIRRKAPADAPMLYDCPECKALVSEWNLREPGVCPYCGCKELDEAEDSE